MTKSNISKSAYTWWIKDWNTSDKVYVLDLAHRGLYRELIDLAMMNDNKVEINIELWCRKWVVKSTILSTMLNYLFKVGLITKIDENFIHIESCEHRLSHIRRGRSGGLVKLKSKQTGKQKGKQKGNHNAKDKDKDKDNNKPKKIVPPSEEEFMVYVKSKLTEKQYQSIRAKLILRYKSWLANDWKDGFNTPIKNWKNKGLNAAIQLLK